MLHSVKAALPGYFRDYSSVFSAYTLHSLCKHECKYAQILRRCLSFKSASVCLCMCMPKYGWFSKSFGAVMLTKTRRDATRPFPTTQRDVLNFCCHVFISISMGIRWNIYLGTSTPDIMRINVCAPICVWARMRACACLSLRGCTTRAQNSLTKNSSVLHFNDLILHKLISQRFLSKTCVCVLYIY